jgi:hypothetical protein
LAAGGATLVGATALFLWPSLFDGVVIYRLLVSSLLVGAALGIAARRRGAAHIGTDDRETPITDEPAHHAIGCITAHMTTTLARWVV